MASAALNWLAACFAGAMAFFAGSCDLRPDDPNTVTVSINGREFKLELALDHATRMKGLSDRAEIPESGGMLFVFPDDKVRVQEFVMRDCITDVDIIYLDRAARVTASHKMKVEEPRRADEPETTDPLADTYESRLKRYSSRYASQFVIELKGGTLDTLGVKDGQQIKLNTADLKKRAR